MRNFMRDRGCGDGRHTYVLGRFLTQALTGEFETTRKLLFLIAQRKGDPEAALCRFLLWSLVRRPAKIRRILRSRRYGRSCRTRMSLLRRELELGPAVPLFFRYPLRRGSRRADASAVPPSRCHRHKVADL